MARTTPPRFGHAGNDGDIIAPGAVMHRYTATEATRFANEWLAVFGANRNGINTRAFLWHVFSAARYPCLHGDAAIEEYKRQSGVEFVVLANDRTLAVFTDTLPASSSLSDYYVFPPNLAWTMAFTHEDGYLGPYFAHHPQYPQLNQVNLTTMQKARAKAEAKRKGWL
jgi:hypothetical protein